MGKEIDWFSEGGPFEGLELLAETPHSIIAIENRPPKGDVILKIPRDNEISQLRWENERIVYQHFASRTYPPLGVLRPLRIEEREGIPYFVFHDMRAWNNKDHIGIEAAARHSASLCDTVHSLNEKWGVIHRDIKPSNVYTNGAGSVWVSDFSIAKIIPGPEFVQRGNHVVGTMGFIPPEAWIDGLVSSDKFAVGATLYHWAKGCAPGLTLDKEGEFVDYFHSLLTAPDRWTKADRSRYGAFVELVDALLDIKVGKRPSLDIAAKELRRYKA